MTGAQIDQELWDKQWRYFSVPLHETLSTIRRVGLVSGRTHPLVICHDCVIDLIKVPNPRTQANTLDALSAAALRLSTASTVTYCSFPLLERRRLPTGIFQRFLRGSHGILSEPSHLPLVLPSQVHYPQHKYPKVRKRRQQSSRTSLLSHSEAVQPPSCRGPTGTTAAI
jgi:hypothetical protein